MKPIDFLKALGLAILVMVLDLLCAVVVVFLWSVVAQQPVAMTDPIVVTLATRATMICGPLLFVLFVWLFSRNRPDRNAYAFGAAVFGFSYLVDWASVGFRGMLEPLALLIGALKLLGALAGAWLAGLRKRRKRKAQRIFDSGGIT